MNTYDTKKGFVVSKKYDEYYIKKLRIIQPEFYYTWGLVGAPSYATITADFYPMVWSNKDSGLIPADMSKAIIMGYNEPDHIGQSNIPVNEAILDWKQHIESVFHIRVSPATAADPLNSPWMETFHKNCQYDILAIHLYVFPTLKGSTANRISEIMHLLFLIHLKYKKPIWITELGLRSSAGVITRKLLDNVKWFMTHLFDELNHCDYIEKYFWKDHAHLDLSGVGNIFDASGNLTELGQLYCSLP